MLKQHQVAVFLCLTAYHVYVAYAYATYLNQKYGVKSRFLLYGVPHIEDVDVDFIETIYLERNEDKFTELVKKRAIYAGRFFKSSKLGRIVNRNERIMLFIFNDLNPVCYKIMRLAKKYDTNNVVTIIDEGLAIYTDTKENLKLDVKFIGREIILRYFFGSPSHYKAIGDDERVDNVIVGFPELYKSLRKARGKRIIEQAKKPLFDKNYIDEFINTFFRITPEETKCTTVLIGQNYSGYGQITEQEELLLSEVGNILNNYGRTIIKPHPTDNVDKYEFLTHMYNNFEVLKPEMSSIPMECLFGFLDCSFIITLNSSSALNIASCFPNKDVIFLVDYKLADSGRVPIQERMAGTNPLHSLNFYPALKSTSNVYIPRNALEFIGILDKKMKSGIRKEYTQEIPQIYPEIDSIYHEWVRTGYLYE